MKTASEIVDNYYQAFENKDYEKARFLLRDNFKFKGPMMEFESADECIEQMKKCGFEAQHKTIRTITDGSQVVKIFEWTVRQPFQGNFRMCECFQVENGKITSADLFYDTANFPKIDQHAA